MWQGEGVHIHTIGISRPTPCDCEAQTGFVTTVNLVRVLPLGNKSFIVGRKSPDKHNREIGSHTVGGRLVDHHRVKQK